MNDGDQINTNDQSGDQNEDLELGHLSGSEELKICLVCVKTIPSTEYLSHVSTHLKDVNVELEKIASPEWLRKNEGLVIKSKNRIFDPFENLDENLKNQLKAFLKQQPKEMSEKDLIQLLNKDFEEKLHRFYIRPGHKLHKNLQYKLQPDPKPFSLT